MPARRLAARCLIDVDAGAYSNLALKSRAQAAELARRDLLFATALLYGTLERKITLDYILNLHLKQKVARLDPEVRAVLRSGLYQCLYMDGVPVRAAVDESVKLCRALKKSSAASLVNAVLRKAASFELAQLDEIPDERLRRSVRYSLCPGLVELFCVQYGADAEDLMTALLERPVTALRVNSLQVEPKELAASLAAGDVETEIGPLPGSLLVKSGDYLAAGARQQGKFRVQSLAAQAAALALDAKPGMSLLDLCAAPGGKTLTAAQEMGNTGRILALDQYDSRLALLRKQAEREGVSIVETIEADAATYDTQERFDRVLCDVPCSGYGEIASKPELRDKEPDAQNPLFGMQYEILQNGARLTKPSGRLVYSTCTLDRRENEDNAMLFLRNHPDFRVAHVAIPGMDAACEAGFLKFIPRAEDSEGFFIATFERMC